MRIAIIGTGISGLSIARALHPYHQITVFEADNRIGGHTNTVTVHERAKTLAIDTGFIVFNRPNYPNLCRLFEQLEVPIQDTEMSFSVHCERTSLEYNGHSLNTLFIQRRNLLRASHWRMLYDIVKFHRHATACLRLGISDQLTVDAFAKKYRYSDAFTERYLVPLGSSLWSASAGQFRQFPIRFVLEFLHNHHMLQVRNRPQWNTVCGGSQTYVQRLIQPFSLNIKTGNAVRSVRRERGKISVGLAGDRYEQFDEVILACHADQALALLRDPEPQEAEVLRYFPYTTNTAVLHTDIAFMPKRRAAWASWNYRIPETETEAGTGTGKVSVTYNMNILQKLTAHKTYLVTLNPRQGSINPQHTIRQFSYQHPTFHPGRNDAQSAHSAFIRRRGLSFCGAYWGYGFHEDGLCSALRVAKAYDAPWFAAS